MRLSRISESVSVALSFIVLAGSVHAEMEFPGPPPGPARGTNKDGVLTLENNVIAATWRSTGEALRPAAIVSKIGNESYDQTGAELFRLATTASAEQAPGVYVAVRLESDHVVALVSRDGVAWMELEKFPRADFSGEPTLVRIGKMNLHALARDNPGSKPGENIGEGVIDKLMPMPPTLPAGRFEFKAGAHQAATNEYPFPAGAKSISCRIDKGTDQGMSWGPALALIWDDGKRFILVGVRDKKPVFNVTTAAGEKIEQPNFTAYPSFDLSASAFLMSGVARMEKLEPKTDGIRVAEHAGGIAFEADFVSDRGIHARWRAELRDNSNYIRQTLALSSNDKAVPLFGVELQDLRVTGARSVGSVAGCPVAAGSLFFGVEMPGARNALDSASARIGFACKLDISHAQSYVFGAVTGVTPKDQRRRAFLYYIERERARPSKPFLHYNCWYDLGFSLDEPSILNVVGSFNEELVKTRGVPVLSYLADDGWDDPNKGLWVENTTKFPGGFSALKAKMDAMNAHLGIWISPLGGYGGAKERTGQARKLGLIPENGELDLAQPGYKKWFQERCLQLMREGGVNAFKWDRAGEGVSPHFMALLDIARNLRAANPEVFINVTVGTWPSPFWLNHVDSTWRMGSADVGWAGKGDDREKWLTFRDGYCHKLFVMASPLYPLNSVMHHGIVHGRCFQGERVGKSGADLKHEARSYFANGTMLQELYLTPSMMTPEAWDRVAESAKWAHANADVLVDAHWTGGDPLKLEPYGYAAWSPRKGTLMIRNPDDKPQSITLDAATVFELPPTAAKTYALSSPYADQRVQTLTLESGKPQTVVLAPFEVLVFDAAPKQ